MADSGSTRAITAALGANVGIAVAKFVGYLLTGSSAMLGEAVHSVADAANELLLMVGKRQARRRPDALHQFGYGRSRYFYSFVVALLLFTLGSAFTLYEGCRKITHPEPLSTPLAAVVILVVSALFEGYSLRTARTQSRPLKGSSSWWGFVRTTRTPELPVVLLEDSAALIGLSLAFGGVAVTAITGNAVWDGVGTVGIGVLIGGVATLLVIETHSLLIGEGATRAQYTTIRSALETVDQVDRVVDMRTQYLGPEELLVAAKVVFDPRMRMATVTEAIDAAEVEVRAAVPAVRVIYLQPAAGRR
ncbi:cation diffusion facilitator family transporter [Mycobacterium sp. pUA109]|uniref:cation diffusion facilitator family transporter n=1 Tax=Mycobacterium sp. pUA109 TaxID=3238982 RepID=UPI00351AFDCD